MNKKVSSICLGVLLTLATMGAFAVDGTITGVTVTPVNPKPGEPITVKVTGNVAAGKSCQLFFLKGDGTPWSLGGNATSFPYSFGGAPYPLWVYNSPGTYTVQVKTTVGPGNNCTGNVQTTVKVSNPVGNLPIGKIGAIALQNPCPQGWHKVSGNADGAFTCKPNKPAPMQCPPKHQWFESECAVGCQQVIY
jgi:hypothetical protein